MIRIPNLLEGKSQEPDRENNIYYNVRIDAQTSNETGANGLPAASFRENRVEPIIENPEHYELAVERFKVPGSTIPIFLWKENLYEVQMEFDGVVITNVLQFIPNGLDLYGDAIWNYQEFLDSLNNSLTQAFIDMKAAKPLAPPTEAPFFTYDAPTKLFLFNAEKLYDDNGAVATIEIFFNTALSQLFSFQYFYESNLDRVKLIPKDNGNNSAIINAKAYFSTPQEYTTLSLWNDLAQIVFDTDTIPVEQELQPGQTNVTQRIVTDFEPIETLNDRTSFQFFPQGPLRYYDLKSKYPMRSIDVKIRWVNKLGQTFPIYLDNDNAATVKLLFRKKQAVKLESDNE